MYDEFNCKDQNALNFFQPLLETCIQNSDENQDDSKDLLIRTSLEIVEQDEIQIVTDRPITILDREENDRDVSDSLKLSLMK